MKEFTVEKLQELENDREFAAKMEAAECTRDVISVLKEFGIEATEEELVAVLAEQEMAMENGELSEDMLDNVAGGGKLWNWIKDRLNNWFKKQSKKNADEIGKILNSF